MRLTSFSTNPERIPQLIAPFISVRQLNLDPVNQKEANLGVNVETQMRRLMVKFWGKMRVLFQVGVLISEEMF